jgi:hypothetical protein
MHGVHSLPADDDALKVLGFALSFAAQVSAEKKPVAGAVEMLLCAPRIAQVTDQFAGRATDIDPFYIVELLAREFEDLRAAHHRDVDAPAIENAAAHERPPIEAPGNHALFWWQ